MFVIATVAATAAGLADMDFDIYRALEAPRALDGVVRLVATGLPLALIAAVAALFLLPRSRARRERRLGAVLATAAAGLGLLVNQPLAHLLDRPRPNVAHPHEAHLLIPASSDPSFPSDHATAAVAIAFAVWAYDRVVGGVLLALGVLLGLTRVVAGTHYPSDVLGGAVVGLVAAAVVLTPPARGGLERVAETLSALWDRGLGHLARGLRVLGATR